MELRIINIKSRNVIGEAKAYLPKDWFMTERDWGWSGEEMYVKVYEGDTSRPAIPAYQVEYPLDYESTVGMALAIEIPEKLVTEIKIGRVVWDTAYWNDEGYKIRERIYDKDELEEYLKDHPDAHYYQGVEYDEWSPKCWEYRSDIDPAFSTTFTSGERFDSPEEAEAWGRERFCEDYAGVVQVGFAVDPKKRLL